MEVNWHAFRPRTVIYLDPGLVGFPNTSARLCSRSAFTIRQLRIPQFVKARFCMKERTSRSRPTFSETHRKCSRSASSTGSRQFSPCPGSLYTSAAGCDIRIGKHFSIGISAVAEGFLKSSSFGGPVVQATITSAPPAEMRPG